MKLNVGLAVWALVICMFACSSASSDGTTGTGSAAVRCATSKFGCMCSVEPFALGADEVSVASCDAPPSGASWQCCHDLDSNGETTACECKQFLCVARVARTTSRRTARGRACATRRTTPAAIWETSSPAPGRSRRAPLAGRPYDHKLSIVVEDDQWRADPKPAHVRTISVKR